LMIISCKVFRKMVAIRENSKRRRILRQERKDLFNSN